MSHEENEKKRPYCAAGKLNWRKLQLRPQSRSVLMNIHPQTVTCQQGPKNHFQYNPDLSFTLKDSAASASLSGWWDKKTTCSLVRLFMCTCPAWRPKSKNSPPSTNLTNLHQTRECTHACSDLPDYLGQFNH